MSDKKIKHFHIYGNKPINSGDDVCFTISFNAVFLGLFEEYIAVETIEIAPQITYKILRLYENDEVPYFAKHIGTKVFLIGSNLHSLIHIYIVKQV